ncbi:MAG: hypothetical protein IKH04_08430 [Kiritimatiellae bacterium]|nr:hypothetical protein [Kiritimatiellia bacterium]
MIRRWALPAGGAAFCSFAAFAQPPPCGEGLPSEEEIGEPQMPAKFADSMTPVRVVLNRAPGEKIIPPPPWDIADWGWNEPWRDPPGPPPPNVALLAPAAVAGVPSGMVLLDEVNPAELARSGEVGRFRSTGTWRTGVICGAECLEAGDCDGDRFAVRFHAPPGAQLLCFEIDYPDDRARTMDVTVTRSGGPGSDYSLQSGVETGLEHPVTGRIATKRFLYWPRRPAPGCKDDGDFALVAMTRGDGEPAAISRIRLYEIPSGALPAAGDAPPCAPACSTRHFALRYEDPAISFDFGVDGKSADDAKLVADRVAAYLKFAGADTLVYPGVWYPGPICSRYQPRPHSPHYLRELCRRFDRDGLSLCVSLNQQRFPGLECPLTRRSLVDGSLGGSPISILANGAPNWGGWHFTSPYYNIAHPAVQEALMSEIDAVLDECAGHPSFNGVYLELFNSINLAWWGSIDAGYNDYAVAAFCRDAGIDLPAHLAGGGDSAPSRERLKARAGWIRSDPKRLEAWIDWRCGVLADFYGRIASRLRERRSDLMLWVGASPPWRPALAKRPDLDDPGIIEKTLREAGIDGRRLAAIPNLALGELSMPCWWRDELRKTQGAPDGALVKVRDLPETPGMYAAARRTRHPFAVLHDSYYETAIGSPADGSAKRRGDGRLSGDWLRETGWRVTAFNASGREALRPYAKALAHGDLIAFARGGFLVGTLGTEEVLAPFMRAFRALPAVPFEDAAPAGAPEAARLRHAVVNGTDWFYAVNTGPDPCRLQLPPGLCDAVTGDPMPCEINLDGYELRAMSRR